MDGLPLPAGSIQPSIPTPAFLIGGKLRIFGGNMEQYLAHFESALTLGSTVKQLMPKTAVVREFFLFNNGASNLYIRLGGGEPSPDRGVTVEPGGSYFSARPATPIRAYAEDRWQSGHAAVLNNDGPKRVGEKRVKGGG